MKTVRIRSRGCGGVPPRRANARTAQTSTEYMMILSVLVIAVVAAGYAFLPSFQAGVQELSYDVSNMLATHGSVKNGLGLAAASASGDGVSSTSASTPARGPRPGGGTTNDPVVPVDNSAGGGF